MGFLYLSGRPPSELIVFTGPPRSNDVDSIMTAVGPVPRRSASKKRHTKPCKFFQLKQCPLSADACDFVHVPEVDCTPPPLLIRRRPCRYFLSGHCTQGASCRFRHTSEGSDDEKRVSRNRKTDRPLMKGKRYPQSSEFIANDYTPGLEPGSLMSAPGPLYPLMPGYMPWAPYAVPIPGYPYDTSNPEDTTGNLISPTVTTSSSDSATGICSPSGSSSSMTDEVIIKSVQMLQIKDPETSSPSISPNTPVNPALVRTPTVITPSSLFADHGHLSSKQLIRPIRSQSLSNTTCTRQRLSYKTKPCKFYKIDNTCPKGDLCSFIHDSNGFANVPTSPEPIRTPVRSSSEQLTTISPPGSPETQSTPRPHHELPTKPVSLQEENKKKGFYPISWRVIGGGVMIGGKIGQPSPGPGEVHAMALDNARSTGEHTDPDPTVSNDQSGDIGKTQSSNHVSISVDTGPALSGPELPDSTFGAQEKVVPNGKATPTGRARAKSISPTPTTERVDIMMLFSAESPGGL